MTRWLGPYSDYACAGIRIVSGLLFACHGAQKLFGVLDANSAELLSLRGAAGVIEFFGGALIALGLFVPHVAFVASGQMALCLFSLARAAGVLADLERRRARCVVLLPVLVCRHPAGRTVQP